MTLPNLPKDALLFLPLGGSGEIGMNLNLYACNGKWIMIDLGMTFADEHLPGVDLIFPDPSFIEMLRDDLLGIVLTHGHEDHIGAVPYLWPELDVPIYATPFTAGLVRMKLMENGLHEQAPLIEVPLNGVIDLGPFKLSYLSIAHSIAEGNALLIDTPYGRVFHTGDWKLDDEPILGTPISPKALTRIGDEGVLALVGDSTNVFNTESSGSEGRVRDNLIAELQGCTGRIVITTFASNAARLDTLGKVATATGRHLIVAGRSLDRIISVAKANGYLSDFPQILGDEAARELPPHRQLIICTGCQGEPRAALNRIAFGDHRNIRLSPGDLVVFSSKVIPGNERSISRIYNQLATMNVDVLTEKDAFIHVSGHPGQPDLAKIYQWIRPKVAIPVHGEMRHMKRHAEFALEQGVGQAIVPYNGSVIQLAPGTPGHLFEVAAGRLVLDGEDIIPHDSPCIVERRRIGEHGFLLLTLIIGPKGKLVHDPIFTIKGVSGAEDDELYEILDDAVLSVLERERSIKDTSALRENLRIATRRAIRAYSGKNTQCDVNIVTL